MGDHFEVHGVVDDDVYTMTCSGAIDATTTAAMRDATLRALNSRCDAVRIDLTRVPLIDSAGLTAIRLAHKAAEIADVDLRVVAPRPAVLRVLRLGDAEYLLGSTANVPR